MLKDKPSHGVLGREREFMDADPSFSHTFLVTVAVMKFRQVGVIMRQGEVSMDVRVRFPSLFLRRMVVAMVVAMRMAVVVFHLFMNMQMPVVLEK